MIKKYKVKVSKKYKKNLSERFNYRNIKHGRIDISCFLCKDFKGNKILCNKKCPFSKFGNMDTFGYTVGCYIWVKKVLPKKQVVMIEEQDIIFGFKSISVSNKPTDKEKIKKFFKVLREVAKQYIEWV